MRCGPAHTARTRAWVRVGGEQIPINKLNNWVSGEEGKEGLLRPLGLADLLAEGRGLVEDGAFVELLERQRLDEEQDALEGSLEQLIYRERGGEDNVGEPSE